MSDETTPSLKDGIARVRNWMKAGHFVKIPLAADIRFLTIEDLQSKTFRKANFHLLGARGDNDGIGGHGIADRHIAIFSLKDETTKVFVIGKVDDPDKPFQVMHGSLPGGGADLRRTQITEYDFQPGTIIEKIDGTATANVYSGKWANINTLLLHVRDVNGTSVKSTTYAAPDIDGP